MKPNNPKNALPQQKGEPQKYLGKQKTLCSVFCQRKLFQILSKICPLADYMLNLFRQVYLINIDSM